VNLWRFIYRIEALGSILFSQRGAVRGGTAFLSSFGTLWLATQIAGFFSVRAEQAIREAWLLFFLLGIALAIFSCWPKLSRSCRLSGRDVIVAIRVGNIFNVGDALVIGSNTTFDTKVSRGLISEKSLQGQFTKRYFGIGNEDQLDRILDQELTGTEHEELVDSRSSKRSRYPMGSTVLVPLPDRTAYLVAIAHMNEHGNASGTPEDLRVALGKLWVFVGERGAKEHIAVPVLGSGPSRINLSREAIIREVIRSFVAACAERTICDQLTIVLSDTDYLTHKIDLESLGDFLRHECTYTRYETGHANPVGTPVDVRDIAFAPVAGHSPGYGAPRGG
jgi:Thoeris protein ThsA, Macro domain